MCVFVFVCVCVFLPIYVCQMIVLRVLKIAQSMPKVVCSGALQYSNNDKKGQMIYKYNNKCYVDRFQTE